MEEYKKISEIGPVKIYDVAPLAVIDKTAYTTEWLARLLSRLPLTARRLCMIRSDTSLIYLSTDQFVCSDGTRFECIIHVGKTPRYNPEFDASEVSPIESDTVRINGMIDLGRITKIQKLEFTDEHTPNPKTKWKPVIVDGDLNRDMCESLFQLLILGETWFYSGFKKIDA